MATHKNAVVIANIRLSKEYLARVNLQEKGLESAEIILQVYQINPLANGKYGLIIHDGQNQMKLYWIVVWAVLCGVKVWYMEQPEREVHWLSYRRS